MLLQALVCGVLVATAQVLTNDPFYGKYVRDFPDYFDLESRMSPEATRPRPQRTVSRVGTVREAARLFNLAGLAYCKNQSTGVPGSKYTEALGDEIQVRLIVEDPKLKVRGLVLLDESRRQVLLAFRGTSSLKNWGANIKLNKVPFGPGVVHAGFKDLTDALLPKYQPYLLGLLRTHPSFRLVVAGHSLGGAIAVLSVARLTEQVAWDRISVYTYGQPRVGDQAFVEWLNSKPMEMTRVVNDNDAIPHLPPNFAGFYHAHTEMFIQGDSVKICSTKVLEDPACSRSRASFPSRTLHSAAFDFRLDDSACGSSFERISDRVERGRGRIRLPPVNAHTPGE